MIRWFIQKELARKTRDKYHDKFLKFSYVKLINICIGVQLYQIGTFLVRFFGTLFRTRENIYNLFLDQHNQPPSRTIDHNILLPANSPLLENNVSI